MTHPPRIYITPEHVDGTDYWDNGSWTTTEGTGVPYEPSPQWQDISTAPKDGTQIVVWARWDWDDMYREKCDEPYAAQVAEWVDRATIRDGERVGTFMAASFNPYADYAVSPTHWMPLPTAPAGE